HGYSVGLSGKWHLGNTLCPQKGHTFWQVHARGGGPYYGAPMMRDGVEYSEPCYVTDAITEHALDFLNIQTREQPFYLGVHYTAPHSPWERNEHPSKYYDPYFENCEFASVPEQALHPWQIDTAPIGDTPERRRELLSGYFASITAMDAQIGRLINALEQADILDDTILIFSGDNGMNMGHLGIWGKGNGTYPQNMFDTSVKVPFIVSWPSRVPAARVSDHLFSHYDFMPSLLGLLGFTSELPPGLPGTDKSKSWTDLSEEADSEIIIFDEYGPVHMIRTREWKYVHRFPHGPDELYHLSADPDEKQNLINDAATSDWVVALRKRLEEWFEKYRDTTFDGRFHTVYGKGQRDRLDSATKPIFDSE
ncbi:MAG: sulfatase, partial [Chthoniobacterales bacterium]